MKHVSIEKALMSSWNCFRISGSKQRW